MGVATTEESFFTMSLKDRNLKSVHNFVKVVLFTLVIENALNDYLYDGGSQYGFKLLFTTLSSYRVVLLSWPIMFCLHSLVYCYWILRIRLRTLQNYQICAFLNWNLLWGICCSVQFFGLFNIIGLLCVKYEISIGCRVILLIEYLKLSIKGYGFVRSNMNFLSTRGDKYELPKYSHYLYFTFAPTLIYKDKYPRSASRNWESMLKYVFEQIACVYLICLLENEYLMKPLQDFGKKPFGPLDIVYIFSRTSMPCFMIMLLAHDILIHSSQNVLAELLRFGERNFFTDWWTSTNMSQFYKKWNILVQESLYEYVYKDFYKYVVPGNKFIAKMAVLIWSIVMHELIFIYGFEISIFPFAISMMVSLTQMSYPETGNVYNILLLFQMYIGLGTVFGLLHLEYFAKQNCPNRPDTLLYLPRLLTCAINTV